MISLKPYNSFGVEAFASELIFVRNEADIFKRDLSKNQGYKILSGGTNVLITGNIQEAILKNEIKGIEIIAENSEYTDIKIGAGENWHEIVLWSLQQNLGGLENLSLIPGNVGAAPVQNIGAYGAELKDVLLFVDGIFLRDQTKKRFSNSECYFSYRNSIFKSTLKEQFFITHVGLRLSKIHLLKLNYGNIKKELESANVEAPTIQDISNIVIKIRSSKLPDPKVLGNAGSFFKNSLISNEKYKELLNNFPGMPAFVENESLMKIPSGWLIEYCGWKGKRVDDVGTYEKQALVLVNYGAASGIEILKYSEKITESVESTFGIRLIPEVNIW